MKAVVFDLHFASVFRAGRNTWRFEKPNRPAVTLICGKNIAQRLPSSNENGNFRIDGIDAFRKKTRHLPGRFGADQLAR
jgi:hypothetical protein